MKKIKSFAPALASQPAPRVLILGSIPSVISLEHCAYYANPQNAFWKIMAELLGFDIGLSYAARVEKLHQAKIALWDVYHSCYRQGSLDSAIKEAEANDIQGLLSRYDFKAIWLNGKKAADGFLRHIDLSQHKKIKVHTLPSTSPAHARMNFETKATLWRQAWQNSSL